MSELTGRRRYTRVMPWSMSLPQVVMALEVEYSEFDRECRWVNKWRFATPDDLPDHAG